MVLVGPVVLAVLMPATHHTIPQEADLVPGRPQLGLPYWQQRAQARARLAGDGRPKEGNKTHAIPAAKLSEPSVI